MTPSFISVRPGGHTVRYTKVGRRWVPTRENPIEVDAKITGTDLLLIAGGVAAIGLVGYLIWVSQTDAAAAETPVSATGSGDQGTILGSGGSSTPIGGAASYSYEEIPNTQPIGEVARSYGTVPVLPTIGPSFP
jgi:hypothetical protein